MVDHLQPTQSFIRGEKKENEKERDIRRYSIPNIRRILNNFRTGIIIINPTLNRTPLPNNTPWLPQIIYPNIPPQPVSVSQACSLAAPNANNAQP